MILCTTSQVANSFTKSPHDLPMSMDPWGGTLRRCLSCAECRAADCHGHRSRTTCLGNLARGFQSRTPLLLHVEKPEASRRLRNEGISLTSGDSLLGVSEVVEYIDVYSEEVKWILSLLFFPCRGCQDAMWPWATSSHRWMDVCPWQEPSEIRCQLLRSSDLPILWARCPSSFEYNFTTHNSFSFIFYALLQVFINFW